ncbi:MAG: DUF3024 domain-containing protein [Bacteroidia bacterium]
MAIDTLKTLDVIEVMENFIEKRRPPESIRDQMDLSYKIEEQSVIVSELRPKWSRPKEMMEIQVAKATFVKVRNHWKVSCFRSDGKWHSYKPTPTVNSISEFVALIEEDKYRSFWG